MGKLFPVAEIFDVIQHILRIQQGKQIPQARQNGLEGPLRGYDGAICLLSTMSC